MPEPSSDNVASFCEFTGAPTHIAVDFLRRYNTTDAAVGQYFEHGGVLPKDAADTWDEDAFHAGREPHGPETRPLTEFNVQGADALNPGIFQPTLSRPPSRVSTYADGQDGPGPSHFSWGQGSDAQETGVVGATGTTFRKVEGEYFDTQNWAMTIPKFTEREYTNNLHPAKRTREAGTPVLLRPTSACHFLPPLMTILNKIPMAREALLARAVQLPDYGASSEWWDGNPIQTSKIVIAEDPATDSESTDLVFETQRLMAFLEQSDRAYGSAQNLLQQRSMNDGENRPGAEFLKVWQDVMNEVAPDEPLNNIFASIAVNDPQEAAKGQPQTATLTEFQVPVTKQILELGGSLYDALDEMVWPEDDGDVVPSVHVQPGEILVACVACHEQGVTGIGVDVPATFYPDRYMEDSIDAVQKMRTERVALLARINDINGLQERLSLIAHPSNTSTISGIDLVDLAKSLLSATPQNETIVRPPGGEDTLVDIQTDLGTYKYAAIAEELTQVLDRVGAKHASLATSKVRATQHLREVTREYRGPQTHPDTTSLHRYTLRGVSTGPSTTYVLANPNSTEDLIDTPIEDWQWWRLHYDQHADRPVTCDRMSEASVLEAARVSSSEIMLVYASDDAMAYPLEPLPPRLRNFVRADNLAFGHELEQPSRRSTPTKRKASAMNEGWVAWDMDEGRQTPVNITVSDDEETGDPLDHGVTLDSKQQPWTSESISRTHNSGHDTEQIKFPDYEEDFDLLGMNEVKSDINHDPHTKHVHAVQVCQDGAIKESVSSASEAATLSRANKSATA